MKASLAICLLLICGVFAGKIKNPKEEQRKTSNEEIRGGIGRERTGGEEGIWARRQLEILRLLRFVRQEAYYKDQYETGRLYNFIENIANYSREEPVRELMAYYAQGMLLKRGENCSLYNPNQLRQAVAYFKTLYYARNWDTFWKTACWGRVNLNEYQFVYALSLSIIQRPELQDIILPQIYEILPEEFFPNEVINEAQRYIKQNLMLNKQQGSNKKSGTIPYIIRLNNTNGNNKFNINNYFREDLGLNAFYYYYNLYYPFWMDAQEYPLSTIQQQQQQQQQQRRRGEVFYYIHQQLLARNNLDRYSSNNENVNVKRTQEGIREEIVNNVNLRNEIEELERRIRDAIDAGFIYTEEGRLVNIYKEQGEREGMEMLCNLIQDNVESLNPRYYGERRSFIQLNQTLRDPEFYQVYQKIIDLIVRYKNNYLRPYNREEIEFKGVRILGVLMDPLITYFEKFYPDISNAIMQDVNLNTNTRGQQQEENVQIRVEENRLTFKPFTYKIRVLSDKPQRAMLRIFIGPKSDDLINMNNLGNQWNYVEFDRYIWNLQTGENLLNRPCIPNKITSYVSYRELMGRVGATLRGGRILQTTSPVLNNPEDYYKFPERLILPRGSLEGTSYQFYYIITPYEGLNINQQNEACGSATGFNFRQYVEDKYPLGYPLLDRPIYDEQMFVTLPNSYLQEVKIYNRNFIMENREITL